MKIKSIISIALLLLCISCSNDETLENTKNSKDLEVVNLNDFVDNGNTTRSGNVENQAVLRFKDYNVYQETLNKLQGMSLEKKEAFFNGLGFKGAYSSLKKLMTNSTKSSISKMTMLFLRHTKNSKINTRIHTSLIQKIRMIYLRIFPLQMLNSNFWVVIKAI